jgi:DNA-binding SARP family transcriptional activator
VKGLVLQHQRLGSLGRWTALASRGRRVIQSNTGSKISPSEAMASSTKIFVRLFGPFAIEAQEARSILLAVTSRKGRALIAYLAMQPRYRASREHLATLLWGDDSGDVQARQSLRRCIASLRRDLHRVPGLLVADRDSVGLLGQNLTVDTREFAAVGTSSQESDLQRAATLFRGEFLADLSIDAEEFDAWRQREATKFAEIAARVFETLSRKADERHDAGAAIAAAERLIALDPTREDWQRTVLLLTARYRGRAAALSRATQCADLLKRELGVTPETETRALVEIIKRGEIETVLCTGSRQLEAAVNASHGAVPSAAAPSARTSRPITKSLLGQRFAAASAIGSALLFIAGCWAVVEYIVISVPNNPPVRTSSENTDTNQPGNVPAPQVAVSGDSSNLANAFASLPQDHIRNVADVADQEVIADYAINVDRACQKGETPTVQVTGPPGHGSVMIRNGDFIHRGPRRFIDVNCPQRVLPGVGV